tara:strand:- start:3238 stop:3546 length:309 start_codon:yes stop_codon:yes gene_type:complete
MTPRQAIIEAVVSDCRLRRRWTVSRSELDEMLQPGERVLDLAAALHCGERLVKGQRTGPGYTGPEVIEAWLDDEDASPRRFSRLVGSVADALNRDRSFWRKS